MQGVQRAMLINTAKLSELSHYSTSSTVFHLEGETGSGVRCFLDTILYS